MTSSCRWNKLLIVSFCVMMQVCNLCDLNKDFKTHATSLDPFKPKRHPCYLIVIGHRVRAAQTCIVNGESHCTPKLSTSESYVYVDLRMNLYDMIFSCIRIAIGSFLLDYAQEILPNYNSIPGKLNYHWWIEAVEELDRCTFPYHTIWTILWFLCHWSKIRAKEIIDPREFIYVLVKNMRSFLLRCHDMMSMVRICASTPCYTEFFKAKYCLKQ